MYGIKNKALAAFGIIFVTLFIFSGYLGISSLHKAKDASRDIGNTILLEQSKEYYRSYTSAQSEILALLFKSVEDDVNNLKDYVTRLYGNAEFIDTKKYWNYRDHLKHLPNNQFIEIETDMSTLWSPTWMKVTDDVINKIEISAYINEYFEPLLKRNINTVANYFIGKEGYLRYYPKIDMLNLFPPDFSVTQDIYFLPATPEKNPNRKLVWTPLYPDPAGQGLMISAVVPIYKKDEFLGVVGTDVTLNNLVDHYITENKKNKSYAILLDKQFKPIALHVKAIADIYGQKEAMGNGEIYQSLLTRESPFKAFFNKIKASNSGFEKLILDDKVLYVSYVKLDQFGWLYANILNESELFSVTDSMNQQIDEITGKLVIDFAFPALVFFVVLMIILSVIINRFVKPIIELSEITKVIASGETEQQIKIKANDEVGRLIDSFKSMQKSINKQKKFLEASKQDTEEDLENTQKSLIQAEKMASLGTMTAGVAHEINNPSNFTHAAVFMMRDEIERIKIFLVELAGGKNTDPAVLRAFDDNFAKLLSLTDTATEGTNRIKTIVDDLRTFTRLDSSQKQQVQVSEIIESTVNLVKTQYDNIELLVTKECDPKMMCFPAKLAQVLMNLTVNACQAIELRKQTDDSLLGQITISTNKVGTELLIHVRDNGNGMSETTKNKIFEPFFTTKEVGKGTGLGMAISFGIIEEHGGRIEIESSVNIGSHITLFLPLNESLS
jgi:signal transduction histidine kinase